MPLAQTPENGKAQKAPRLNAPDKLKIDEEFKIVPTGRFPSLSDCNITSYWLNFKITSCTLVIAKIFLFLVYDDWTSLHLLGHLLRSVYLWRGLARLQDVSRSKLPWHRLRYSGPSCLKLKLKLPIRMAFSCDNEFVPSLRSSFPSAKILFPLTTEVVFAEREYFSLWISLPR